MTRFTVACCLLPVAWYVWGQWTVDSGSPSLPGLLEVVEPDSVEFRAVGFGRFRGSVMIHNQGPGDAAINGVSAGCGCAKIVSFPRHISAGGSGLVNFEIDTKFGSGSSAVFDEEIGTVSLKASFQLHGEFGGGEKPGLIQMTCSGTFELPLMADAAETNLGTVSSAETSVSFRIGLKPRRVSREVRVSRVMRGVTAQIEENALQLLLHPRDLKSRDSEDGAGVRRLLLEVTEADGSVVLVPITFRVNVVPPIRIRPSRLAFGPFKGDELLTRRIEIIPDGRTVMSVRSVEFLDESCSFHG